MARNKVLLYFQIKFFQVLILYLYLELVKAVREKQGKFQFFSLLLRVQKYMMQRIK